MPEPTKQGMNKPRCPDCDGLVTKIDQTDLAEMGLADTRKDRSQLYRCIQDHVSDADSVVR